MSRGFEALYLAHRDELLRYVRARGESNPEDLLQDLWVKLPSAASEPIAEPLGYLYRMASNLILDRHRADRSRVVREKDWADATLTYDAEASDVCSGERISIAREEIRAVQATLHSLGSTTETIFRLFRLEGVSQQQIARDMGLSVSSIEKHLRKAYRTLLELRSGQDAD